MQSIKKLGDVRRAPIAERRSGFLNAVQAMNDHEGSITSPTLEKVMDRVAVHIPKVQAVRHIPVGLGKDKTERMDKLFDMHKKGVGYIKNRVSMGMDSIIDEENLHAKVMREWVNKLFSKRNVRTRSFYIMTVDDLMSEIENSEVLIDALKGLSLMPLLNDLLEVHNELKSLEQDRLNYRAEAMKANQKNEVVLNAALDDLAVLIDTLNIELLVAEDSAENKALVLAMNEALAKVRMNVARKRTMRKNKRTAENGTDALQSANEKEGKEVDGKEGEIENNIDDKNENNSESTGGDDNSNSQDEKSNVG